jgi:hypothetical protein
MTLGIDSKCTSCGTIKSKCIVCGNVHCRCTSKYDERYIEDINLTDPILVSFGVFLGERDASTNKDSMQDENKDSTQ